MQRTGVALVSAMMITMAVGAAVRSSGPGRQTSVRQVVKLRLTAGGLEVGTLSTPSGTMVKVGSDGVEELGLTPFVRPDGVALDVAVRNPTAGEFRVIGHYVLGANKPVPVGTDRTPLEVEWVGTTEATVPSAGPVPQVGPCSMCCVVCDGLTLCACEVTTNCGSCCCKDVCSCSAGGPAPRRAEKPGSRGRGAAGARL